MLSCRCPRTARRAGLTPAYPLVPANVGFPTAMHDCGAGVAVRHARPPAARQPLAALPAPPGRRPPTGPAPSRLPGRPRLAVPVRHRPEAMLDSEGAPEGCPDHRRDGKEPQHAVRLSLCPSCSQGQNVRRCCVGSGSSQTRLTDGSDGRITRSARALVQEPGSAEPPVSCTARADRRPRPGGFTWVSRTSISR